MVRGDGGRRVGNRRGGPFRRNEGFRDFDRDRFGDRRRDNDRNGGRRSGGFGGRDRRRGDREERSDRGDRRGRGRGGRGGRGRGGRGGRRERGGDIESQLENYWKKGGKETRNDGEITAELDDYWKKGRQNEAAKKAEKTENAATEQTATNGASKDKEVEL